METLTIDIITAVVHVLFILVMFFFAYLISVIFSELSKIKKQAIELKKEIEQTKFKVEQLGCDIDRVRGSYGSRLITDITLLSELIILVRKLVNSKNN